MPTYDNPPEAGDQRYNGECQDCRFLGYIKAGSVCGQCRLMDWHDKRERQRLSEEADAFTKRYLKAVKE